MKHPSLTPDLSRSRRIAASRELRLIELEKEVNALCLQRGESERYPFASKAYQAAESLGALDQRNAALRCGNDAAPSPKAAQGHDAELRRSESELRDFVENAAMGLQWIGPDGTVLWANQTELDLLGYTREEYIGRHISGFYAEQSVIEDILVRLTRGETLLDYSARLRHKDGSIRHVLVNSNVLVEDGKFIHTRCFTRDITERTHARDALRESEAFNRSIIESSPDCIKVLDLEGNLLSMFNGQQLLGIEDIHAFLNKSWLAFWKDGDRQAAQLAINAALAGGAGRFIGFFSTLSGEPKWWDVAITPIRGADGKPARLLAVSRDVTLRRQAEMNLEFLASVSRDLVQWTNVQEMMQTASAKIAAHLQLSLCAFVDIDEAAERVVINHEWHREDVPGLAGVHRLADFVGQKFIQTARAGEAIIVSNVASDPRTDPAQFTALKIASFICMPLIRDGRWQFALCLYKSGAHDWREDEIALTRELTARIWTRLERLRVEAALQDNAWCLRYATESAHLTFVEVDLASGVARTPENFAAVMGYVPPGPDADGSLGVSALLEHVVPCDRPMVHAALQEFFDGKPAGTLDYRVMGDDQIERWIETKWSTLPGPDGKSLKSFSTNLDITGRKQAEKALRKSEERFRALVTASSDVVYRMSADWREIRQLDGQNFIADTAAPSDTWLQEYIPPDDQPRVLAAINEAIQTKSLFEMEHQVVTVDGSLGWTFSHAIPLLDAQGEITEWFGTASDVTQQKRAEQALRESEERYRNLFNSMDEGYCIIEMIFDANDKPVDYRFLEINPSFEALTGMHEAEGKRIRELVPTLEEYWFETYGKVALTGEAVRFVNEAKPMNRWFDVYAFQFGGAESRKVAILFTNITERKKAEEALRKSEARFRALFDWGPIAMYSCDSAGVIQEYNHGAVKLWQAEPRPGETDQQFRGSFKTWLPNGTFVPYAKSAMTRILKGEAPAMHNMEVVIERRDGSRINVVVNVVPLLDGQGRVTAAISCFYDITERTQLQQKTLEQAETLADLDRRKDEFLAMLGHELRNPLAPIANAVHLLRLQKNEDPVQQKARAIIERQVGQLNRLVDDLLEVSRITTGRVQLRHEQVAISGIVERAIETALPLITQRRHELKVFLPPETIWLHADAARLEQVVVNLLTNAAKYTDEGGRIELAVQQEGGTAVLRVKDTGIGIAADLLPRIFELFTQAKRSLDRSQGGLGIGLSLVQRLVELHGGTVEVHSVLGRGSEFVLRLPAMPAAAALMPPPVIDSVAPNGKSCRVLVVDDNVDAAHTLTDLLSLTGYQVMMAHDGPDAIKAASAWRPDVVLLDIGLPGLSGLEVAKRIRQDAALEHTVLVALTGYGLEADRQRSRQAGFDHHLVKPADFDEVEKILQSVAKKAPASAL